MIDLKGEIGELKTALVETGVDVGPVIYLARTFQTDIDTVVKFFIFILIFVFDPMAVMFVISYNVALENRDDKKWPVYGEKKKEEPIDGKWIRTNGGSKEMMDYIMKKENG